MRSLTKLCFLLSQSGFMFTANKETLQCIKIQKEIKEQLEEFATHEPLVVVAFTGTFLMTNPHTSSLHFAHHTILHDIAFTNHSAFHHTQVSTRTRLEQLEPSLARTYQDPA